MRRRLFLAIGILLVILLAGVMASWWYVDYKASPSSWPAKKFSSAEWKMAAPEERYVFYRDLAESGVLEGATKAEVITLLGPPQYESPEGRSMSYTLKYGGRDELLFNSLYFLDIKIWPPNGRVQQYAVRAD